MNRYNYYLLSVIMHGLLLTLFSVYFNHSSQSRKFGNTEAKSIASFIYQGSFSQSVLTQDKLKLITLPEKKAISTDAHSAHALTKKSIKKSRENIEKEASSTQSSVSQGELATTLIALLHDAIQRKQHYPASAFEMQREGRITVAFQLFEDGHISNVRRLTSSGTSSLDNAAVQAVMDAAPFKGLSAYIKKSEEYQIDIVFELA